MRIQACNVLTQVLFGGASLSPTLAKAQAKLPNKQDRAQLQAICFETCRYYYKLKAITDLLLKHPIKAKQQAVSCLIYIGLYQLLHTQTPAYAIVSETLKTAEKINFKEAKPLLNAVLQNFIRKKETLLSEANKKLSSQFNHPDWLIEALQKAWPEQWQTILEANNQPPPLFIRVNANKIKCQDYLTLLDQYEIKNQKVILDDAIQILNPVSVDQLPNFFQGYCSIQDLSGQYVAEILELKNGQLVLDACAAPGSKTCHILEYSLEKNISLKNLTALEKDTSRISLINENILRLGLDSTVLRVVNTDATDISTYWDKQHFDRIMLDAPCSATGVIRRHPDIKLLRRPQDIESLAEQQWQLLNSLWSLLANNGLLVYTTCSILPAENENLISRFIEKQIDCKIKKINCPLPGIQLENGYQLLPQVNGADGFYYAVLQKM